MTPSSCLQLVNDFISGTEAEMMSLNLRTNIILQILKKAKHY